MAIRKNKKRIDPRYFMDEKTDILKEAQLPAWERPGYTPPEEDAAAIEDKHTQAQAHYQAKMDEARETVTSLFGEEDGETVWELITTALHSKPGSARGMEEFWHTLRRVEPEPDADASAERDYRYDDSPYDAGY